MSGLAFVAFASIAMGAPDAETYAEAHQATLQTGRPMLVMVSTDWCAPCQVMKKTVIPRLRERGLFSRVAFATVNPDQDGDLARQLIGGGPVPQLLFYRKTSQGWVRKTLIGRQSVEQVEEFVNQGIAEETPLAAPANAKSPGGPTDKTVAKSEKRPSA